jgi:MFS transporter, PAT family, beta-lactamase induction signal transducer AmpG
MADEGVDLGTIGLFSLVGLPYVLKFLWAPLVDAAPVPFLSRRFGRRRGWLIATQLALLVAIAGMGLVDPVTAPFLMAFAALIVAFLSATQDIVVDAFRVETLNEDQYAAGTAVYIASYNVALRWIVGIGAVGATYMFAGLGAAESALWPLAYLTMASLMIVGLLASFLAREPSESSEISANQQALAYTQRFQEAVINPFKDFIEKPAWFGILAFVLLFKFGDAFAGAMVAPFALDIGFDKLVFTIIGGVSLPATLVGAFLGGILARIVSMHRALWIAGILQMVSNLAFCWLAWMGPDETALATTVAIEATSAGVGTVIFVAYLSSQCSTRAFTATQFALLSSLAAVGRTVLSASAGFVAASVGWVPFFLITTLAAVPGLLLLVWLGHKKLLDGERPLRVAGKYQENQ